MLYSIVQPRGNVKNKLEQEEHGCSSIWKPFFTRCARPSHAAPPSLGLWSPSPDSSCEPTPSGSVPSSGQCPCPRWVYARRAKIETLFDTLKNILGGMRYHFWSKYLQPASRRPVRRDAPKPTSSRPDKTRNTLGAIEKFVQVQLIVLGALQLLAQGFAREIRTTAQCWLRTPCGDIPSEFVTRHALANLLRTNILSFARSSITRIILDKQGKSPQAASSRKVG